MTKKITVKLKPAKKKKQKEFLQDELRFLVLEAAAEMADISESLARLGDAVRSVAKRGLKLNKKQTKDLMRSVGRE